MTTSFTRTREQFGALVLRKIGILASGETADTDDLNIVYEALDLRLKELHEKGIQFWKMATAATTLTYSASVTAVALPSDFIMPQTIGIVDGIDTIPIDFISHSDYEEITDKSATGFPQKAHIDYSTNMLYLWPIPNQTKYGKLTYEKKPDDTAVSTVPDLPVEIMRSMADVVANDIIDQFNINNVDQNKLMINAQKGEQAISTFMVMRMAGNTIKLDYF